jgi:ER lumen protein retaining receptor
MRDIIFFIVGYCIQLGASGVLLYQVTAKRTFYGLSQDMQIMFCLACFTRCIWTLDTRLVETFFAYLELLLSTAASVGLCLYSHKYRYTNVKAPPYFLSVWVLTPVGVVLSILFHPGTAWFSYQTLIAFTMYIEALALIPQLYLMRHMIEIEPLTSHYVGLLVIARIFRMVFWFEMYMLGENFIDLFISDLVHTILSADYLFLWCKKLRHGGRLVYSI